MALKPAFIRLIWIPRTPVFLFWTLPWTLSWSSSQILFCRNSMMAIFCFTQAGIDHLEKKVLFQAQHMYGFNPLGSVDLKFYPIPYCWIIHNYTREFRALQYTNVPALTLQKASFHKKSHINWHIVQDTFEKYINIETFLLILLQPYTHTLSP